MRAERNQCHVLKRTFRESRDEVQVTRRVLPTPRRELYEALREKPGLANPLIRARLTPRHRGQQRLRVGVARDGQQRRRVALLDDATVLHHGDVVGQVLDDAEVVSDEEVGDAELRLQVPQQVQDLRLHRDVEGGGGLVADDQARFDRERARDGQALALAAGKLVRVTRQRVLPQPDAIHQRPDACRARSRWRDVRSQRQHAFFEDFLHPHARVQRRKRVLEDDLHPCDAHRAARRPRGRRARAPSSRRLTFDPGDSAQQLHQRLAGGGLAATGFADQGQRASRRRDRTRCRQPP